MASVDLDPPNQTNACSGRGWFIASAYSGNNHSALAQTRPQPRGLCKIQTHLENANRANIRCYTVESFSVLNVKYQASRS